jgi:hypothetical protein
MRLDGRGCEVGRPIRCWPLAGYGIHSSGAAFAEPVLMGRAARPLSYVARIGTDAT